ncbi:MAG: hemolysin family protein [Acidimicrobiales bacterium]
MDPLALAVAVVFLVVSAGVLAMAETALTHLPRAKALALVEEGRRGAVSLERLLEHRERYLNPILLLVLFCHLATATLVGIEAEARFGPGGIALAAFLELLVIFVVSEAAPKTYALQHTERAALMVAPIAMVVGRIAPLRLLTRALVGLSNVLLPGTGRRAGPAAVSSEGELLALADEAVEAAVLEVEERALIRSIIDFGDTIAREVMVPRPDMVAVAADVTVAQATEIAISHGYSRIPAYDAGIDDVIGIVFVKDLMRATREHKTSSTVATLLRPAFFVPETKKVSELMREMQAKSFHLAIVIDEYGGTAGLVTLEDLIEELVGEIVDEFDVEDPVLEPLADGTVRVNARMPLVELNDLLDLDLPEGTWDTVGGLVFDQLGHVPSEGEELVVQGHVLRAEKVQGRRIGRIRISTPRA